MSNELTTKSKQELINVLQSSLYVGSKPESVEMVLSYCEAAGLDPMQKPVHIVPMNTKNPVTGNYEWRDVIMPGIGLYRIQADRSGKMAGITEPEFGKEITADFVDRNGKKITVTYPEWCRVTVKKMVGDKIAEFTAKEFWLENYATDSGQSSAPNKMWKKRPKGQIAKCAEAQALRKSFPEIGQAPTAEEMEGKEIDITPQPEPLREIEAQVLPDYSKEDFNKNSASWMELVKSGSRTPEDIINMVKTRFTLSQEQEKTIRSYKSETRKGEDEWLDDYEATSADIDANREGGS